MIQFPLDVPITDDKRVVGASMETLTSPLVHLGFAGKGDAAVLDLNKRTAIGPTPPMSQDDIDRIIAALGPPILGARLVELMAEAGVRLDLQRFSCELPAPARTDTQAPLDLTALRKATAAAHWHWDGVRNVYIHSIVRFLIAWTPAVAARVIDRLEAAERERDRLAHALSAASKMLQHSDEWAKYARGKEYLVLDRPGRKGPP